jgi:hypothetical protein
VATAPFDTLPAILEVGPDAARRGIAYLLGTA